MSEPTVPPGPPPAAPPPPPPSGSPPPPPPSAPPPAAGDSGDRGLMIVLSYLWLLALIPLLMKKDDPEVQWHAKHGLVLFGAEIVLGVGIGILQGILSFVDFGCTGCILYSVFWVVVLVVHILCIVKGLNGQRFLVPGVSQFADKF